MNVQQFVDSFQFNNNTIFNKQVDYEWVTYHNSFVRYGNLYLMFYLYTT